MPETQTDPVLANAYAITYRLLGDRPAAQAAAGIAAERVRSTDAIARPDWLGALAAEAVAQSVGPAAAAMAPAAAGSGADDRDTGLRAALRRRLASATDEERSAAALHHLAGYPVDDVATFTGRSPADVSRSASVLAPPPGVSYRELGDPELLGPAPAAADGSARRRGISLSTAVIVLVVLALVVAAARSVGPRPTLGAEADASTHVGPDVAARLSGGCSLPPQAPGTYASTAAAPDGPLPFRLAVPETTAPPSSPGATRPGATVPPSGTTSPRALLIAIADSGTTADELAQSTGLERAALDAGDVVATVAPRPSSTTGAAGATPTTGVRSVVREVLEHVCIDSARVTVAGLGTGGQIATAIGCAEPTLASVVAAVGGASMPADCPLRPPVSLLLLTAADDRVMPADGGVGPGAPTTEVASGLPADPAGRVARDWATAIDAPGAERRVAEDGTATQEATAPSGATVRWVNAATGGHTWTDVTTAAVLDFARAHARS